MSPPDSRFSVSARLNSVGHALRGAKVLLSEQHNARIHLVTAIAVLALSLWLPLSVIELIVVIVMIGWVLTMEALNSVVEYLCDHVTPEHDPMIGKIKDVAAAAVLFSAVTAALVGLIIFLPKLWSVIHV